MGYRNKKTGDFVKSIMHNPPKEVAAKTDATTNVVPGASQFFTESVSFDYEMEPYRGHQGTYSQKRKASDHKRREYYKHMDSAKGNFSAAGDTLKNKGTYCSDCHKFHKD